MIFVTTLCSGTTWLVDQQLHSTEGSSHWNILNLGSASWVLTVFIIGRSKRRAGLGCYPIFPGPQCNCVLSLRKSGCGWIAKGRHLGKESRALHDEAEECASSGRDRIQRRIKERVGETLPPSRGINPTELSQEEDHSWHPWTTQVSNEGGWEA